MKKTKQVITLSFAAVLVVLCASCTSMSYVSGVQGRREAPVASAHEDALKGPVSSGQGENRISVEDMARPAGERTVANGKSSQTGLAGREDNIPFRDLPRIQIDERSLGRATTVGHDALIERELKRLLGEFGEKDDKVETVFLNEVKLYVKAFQTNDQYRRFMNSSLRRSAGYMPAVKEVFKKRNIPEDMAFIAFLESGFNPNARSHAGAVGMWQFMSGTAKRYSLRVSDRVDDRLDPVKSTFAAVEYFHDLIAIFGPRSFLLALAAYNCGEGRIISCLKRIDNPMEERTFWHIRTCLAKETREYPPKVIAAAVIGSNPEVFGFRRFENQNEILEISAAFAGYRSPEPDMGAGEPRRSPEAVHKGVSKGKGVAASARTKTPEVKPLIYVVKKNNSLSTVADMFQVDKDDIRKWNKMKDQRVVLGQKLKVYPPVAMDTVVYKVKKGDTITEICQSFRVRPKDVIAGNGLKNGLDIREGRTLTVYRTQAKKPLIYMVKKGDSLAGISDKFNVYPKDVMRWNNIEKAQIYPRQQLKIYASL